MARNLLFGAPIDIFGKYLDRKDYYPLSQVHPDSQDGLYHAFKKTIINRIESRLQKKFGHLFPAVRQIMSQDQVLISGSYIIQAILGVKWEESDIDFYTVYQPENHKPAIDQFFEKYSQFYCDLVSSRGPEIEAYHRLSNSIKIVNEYDDNRGGLPVGRCLLVDDDLSDENDSDNGDDSSDSSDDHHDDLRGRFQVIQCQLSDQTDHIEGLKNMIHQTFDFDICKNIFYYDQNQQPQLSIYKAQEIITKITTFRVTQNPTKNLLRFAKYHYRGFNFLYHGKKIEDLDSLIQALYQDREIQMIDVITPDKIKIKSSFLYKSRKIVEEKDDHICYEINDRRIISSYNLEFKSNSPIDPNLNQKEVQIYLKGDELKSSFHIIKKIRVNPDGLTLHIRVRKCYNHQYCWSRKDQEERYIETKYKDLEPKPIYQKECDSTNCYLHQLDEIPDHLHLGSSIFLFSKDLKLWKLFESHNLRYQLQISSDLSVKKGVYLRYREPYANHLNRQTIQDFIPQDLTKMHWRCSKTTKKVSSYCHSREASLVPIEQNSK